MLLLWDGTVWISWPHQTSGKNSTYIIWVRFRNSSKTTIGWVLLQSWKMLSEYRYWSHFVNYLTAHHTATKCLKVNECPMGRECRLARSKPVQQFRGECMATCDNEAIADKVVDVGSLTRCEQLDTASSPAFVKLVTKTFAAAALWRTRLFGWPARAAVTRQRHQKAFTFLRPCLISTSCIYVLHLIKSSTSVSLPLTSINMVA